ncbi:MAG TPA: hypothetical protein VLA53_02955 [Nitrosopumilaceae archaeon]|nr:hypothetical protein [Nitrosopumilaceae archaeon]
MYIVEKRLVDSLETQTENIVKIDIQKIENAIFEKYHFSLIECSKNTFKLESILRTVFGLSQILLEKTILENALELATSTEMDKEWVIIHDKSLISTILNTYTDKNKERILEILSNKQPHIIAKIVEISGLQENTAYKKINELIRDGMLVERGAIFTSDAREIKKYVGIFKNLKFGMVNNKIAVQAKLNKEALKASYIIALLQSVRNEMVDEQQKIQLKQQIQLEKATELM